MPNLAIFQLFNMTWNNLNRELTANNSRKHLRCCQFQNKHIYLEKVTIGNNLKNMEWCQILILFSNFFVVTMHQWLTKQVQWNLS